MSSGDSVPQWYTRRAGVERGPFSEADVSRYILLGRIQLADDLRCGDDAWVCVAECDTLIPAAMKLPDSPENRARLMTARMAVDERQPGDRRARYPDPPREIMERRSGIERRKPEPEPDAVMRFRALRGVNNGSPVTAPAQPLAIRHKLVIAAAILMGLLLLVWATSSAD